MRGKNITDRTLFKPKIRLLRDIKLCLMKTSFYCATPNLTQLHTNSIIQTMHIFHIGRVYV